MIGGTGIVWFGISAVTRVNGSHFEGFALVLGAGLILQGPDVRCSRFATDQNGLKSARPLS